LLVLQAAVSRATHLLEAQKPRKQKVRKIKGRKSRA